jgi:hypothetical protein
MNNDSDLILILSVVRPGEGEDSVNLCRSECPVIGFLLDCCTREGFCENSR